MLCYLDILLQMTLETQSLIASALLSQKSYNICLSMPAGQNRLTTGPSLSVFLSSVASSRKQATRLMLSQHTMQGSCVTMVSISAAFSSRVSDWSLCRLAPPYLSPVPFCGLIQGSCLPCCSFGRRPLSKKNWYQTVEE